MSHNDKEEGNSQNVLLEHKAHLNNTGKAHSYWSTHSFHMRSLQLCALNAFPNGFREDVKCAKKVLRREKDFLPSLPISLFIATDCRENSIVSSREP
jgi:hypothetical protein